MATILHISDLHFGRHFQWVKWDQLRRSVLQQCPDLVIITGDLVNSPWRFTLKQACRQLEELKRQLAEHSGKPVEIALVPGNHDTRFSGIVPLGHITRAAVATLLLWLGAVAGSGVLGQGPVAAVTWAWLGATLLVPLALSMLRLLMTADVCDAFRGHYLDRVRKYPGLGIGIIPFDSATTPKFGAHGRFPDNGIALLDEVHLPAADGSAAAPEPDNLFWIAAVHHHVLPLPYDSDFEFTMIMENAGTMLYELAKKDVPLILHGHKHHHHFARALIRSDDGAEHDISVLSAGTPTENRNVGRYLHSFNVITVKEDLSACFTVYRSDVGGTFSSSGPYALTAPEVVTHRQYLRNLHECEAACDKMLASSIVDAYGNVTLVKEFSGFRARQPLGFLTHEFNARSECGAVISSFSFTRADCQPVVQAHTNYRSAHHVVTGLAFSAPLLPGNEPLSFHVGFEVANAIALDTRQFGNMHPGSTDNLEYMIHVVPKRVAVKELFLELRFPPLVAVPSSLKLSMKFDLGSAAPWTELPGTAYDVIETSSAVYAKIKAPPPGAAYKFCWRVPDKNNTVSRFEKPLAARLYGRQNDLADFMDEMFELACQQLIRDFARHDRAVIEREVSAVLYCYARAEGILKNIAAIGNDINGLGRDEHPYGLGLAGQAYKTGKIIVYEPDSPKAVSERNSMAERHKNPHAEEAGAADFGIDCGPGMAIPIFPVTDDQHGLVEAGDPFGVLQLSFGKLGKYVKLTDTEDDRSTTTFQVALCAMLCSLVQRTSDRGR